MSQQIKDRVLNVSTTTGTGTYTLGAAVAGYQSWTVIGDGNTAWYYAEAVDSNGIPTGDWEVGLGTFTLSGTTLARTTVLASSNSGSPVSWGAGTKRIGSSIPAANFSLLTFPPTVRGNRTSTQSITAATATPIQFVDADSYDTDGMHDPSTNSGRRFVAVTAGVYDFKASIQFASAADANIRIVWFDINGGGLTLFPQSGIGFAILDTYIATTGQFKLAAGDYIEVVVYQGSVGAVNIAAGAICTATRIANG